MRPKIALGVIAAMLLAACSPQQRRMPSMQDEAGLTAAIKSLSPWKDGSPDRSDDRLTPAEPGSDRALFANWVLRFANHETYAQHDRDYQPMVMPATVGDAIEEQRRFEQERQATLAREEAEAQRRQEAEVAERERQARAYQAAEQERTRIADEQAAAEAAVLQQQQEHDAALNKADVDCRQRREQAEMQASLDPKDPRGAIARARASIHCPSDRQLDSE